MMSQNPARQIVPGYFVAGQITHDDIPALAEAGIKTLIINRPDAEIPPDLGAARIRETAEAAGMTVVDNPVTHQTLSPETAATQRAAIEASAGDVLAYCASGNRSTVLWAIGMAGEMGTDDILAAARAAGYNLDGLREVLDRLASHG